MALHLIASHEMTPNTTALAHRLVGRLFSEDGRLHFVLDVDTGANIARISCRVDGQQQIVHMPVPELRSRLESSSNLRLDALSSTDESGRIEQRADGWFFAAREGLKGPYESAAEASAALGRYVISRQDT